MKIVIQEEGDRSELSLNAPVTSIGRSVDNDIRLASTLVSRHHCNIEHDGGAYWIVDLGSANGTLLNGHKVDRERLVPGDELKVGGAALSVEIEDSGNVEFEANAGLRTADGESFDDRRELRVFARTTHDLARQTDLMPLLRSIVDSAVDLVGGERGFVLLEEDHESEPDTALEETQTPDVSCLSVRVARSFDRSDIPVPRSRLSLGIALQVFQSGEPLLSLDAKQDERFTGMNSVEDLRLRSVLCLPIAIEGRVCGVLYVDNRLQNSAFSPADLELSELFADQASIALQNAHRVRQLRERAEHLERSRRQIERLNEQLGRKVRDRDSELAVVRAELGRERGRYDYTSIVGASDGMRRVFQQLDRIIESNLPVLIQGESGTGKELIARAIHFNGSRSEAPFITENCAALPDSLLESELFGHVRGAFTGAHRTKKGLLEQADGGTLFLDEIGDMSTEMQKKLLRALQEGEFRPVGSDRRIQVNVRLLTASHRDLELMMHEGEFREDLFYRINVLTVDLPPLRRRRDDIPLLAEHLVARAAREAGMSAPILVHEVVASLTQHDWPGNVRELENEMRRLVVLSEGEVRLEHLSASILEPRRRGGDSDDPIESALSAHSGNIREAVAELERRSISAAMERAEGNKSRAAAELGISRFALQRKMDKYGLAGASGGDDEPAPGV